ncbi:MAG: metallophosphoesterase family protein [Candidatus Lokiarchaeota archaeon]|nr:metallophosphoesterase family protein [Candidatus Lokiarchaeota archaeon]
MEIGIISDTHLDSTANYSGLYKRIEQAFAEVDLILHAGDITNIAFINDLERIAPVEAVAGNVDDSTIHERFATFRKLELYHKNIGLIHIMPSFSFVKQENLDILISGHTHIPLIKEFYELNHGFLYLNPGSPTHPKAPPLNTRYQVQRKPLPTVIILDLDEELSSAYIVTLR